MIAVLLVKVALETRVFILEHLDEFFVIFILDTIELHNVSGLLLEPEFVELVQQVAWN